jgi:peptide/nickel transport system permease protein
MASRRPATQQPRTFDTARARGVEAQRPAVSWWRWLANMQSRYRGIPVGGMLLLGVVTLALLAPVLTSIDPTALNPRSRLTSPGGVHLFGTDNFGRDVFSRTIWGARLSLQIGCLVALFTTLSGTMVGLSAGYFRRFDTPIMRLMDGMMAFPGILLAIALMSALGASKFNVVAALTIVYTPRLARVVRSMALTVRELPFVEAARAQGMSHYRIVLRHILPQCLSPLIVQGTFIFAEAVLGEASLSFLGAGTPPYIPSWGNMLGEARAYLRGAPWTMLFPGLTLSVTVLALNLLGDGIRDLLDPRLRKG